MKLMQMTPMTDIKTLCDEKLYDMNNMMNKMERNVNAIQEETFVNDIWNLYFHDPYNTDWGFQSYKRICTISSVEMFWTVHKLLEGHLHSAMFFLMREHVFPCWDDPHNITGGCLSLKVLKQDLKQFWEHISTRLVGECLMKDVNLFENVNGISTSPKKHFCIIKIWLKSNDFIDRNLFDLPGDYQGEFIFKSNRENIENNNT